MADDFKADGRTAGSVTRTASAGGAPGQGTMPRGSLRR